MHRLTRTPVNAKIVVKSVKSENQGIFQFYRSMESMDYSLKFQVPSIGKIFDFLSYISYHFPFSLPKTHRLEKIRKKEI